MHNLNHSYNLMGFDTIEINLVWLFQCSYAFQDVCPRMSVTINRFSKSKVSDLDPTGVVHNFSKDSEIQKFLIISERGQLSVN